MKGSFAGREEAPGGPVVPLLRPVHPLRPWLIGVAFGMALIPAAVRPRMSGNVWPRYMTIESIVERGTQAVDRSPMLRPSGTPDLARYGGRLYSDKPPVLSVLGAAVYAPLYLWGGLRFPDPRSGPRDLVALNLVMIAAFVATSTAWTLAWVRRLLQTTRFPVWVSDLLTLAFGAGSLLLTYGVTFNNHSVAAGLITAAFGLVILEDPALHRVGRRRAWAGCCASMAATIDLPAGGVAFVVLGGWLAARARGLPVAFLLGAVGPALLHAAAQWPISGSLRPAQLDRRALEYPGSYWTSEVGRFRETGPRWRFGLELLIGPQGWLTITPALVFAPIGLALASRRGPLKAAALATSTLVGALLVFYIWGVRVTDFAGLSFGVRHLLPVTPLACVFAAVALDRLRGRWAGLVFATLLAIGAVYAYEGMQDPWTRAERRDEPAMRFLQRFVLYPHTSFTR